MSYKTIICGIYCIENIDTNKKYIGQSKNIYKRWNEHKWYLNNNIHDNDYLQKAWNKYGAEHFIFSVIEECDIDKLDELEIYYIKVNSSCDRKYGYNLRGGGGRLGDMTPEVRNKLSGVNNPMYGKHHSEETRQKIRDGRLGKYDGKNHPRHKPIYCPELNLVFWGAKEASDLLGISKGNICSCCRGDLKSAGKHPITGKKLHWFYYEDAVIKWPNIERFFIA